MKANFSKMETKYPARGREWKCEDDILVADLESNHS